ncbi:maleylpyruvate isomerase N-terminal domain-containing protein [Glycomyces buryatensis]|uniref:Maleylpyruvate isomerase family protein n=1 Tax=Glycomyces buryatensis TaxID=2570927 RepID=A0A4S8PQL2_9ACTN|nr:maleylpyruvate isomerase N-terminal domain-containing protein [Glycomyces buryatensis]THV33433.1 maleylpyruvate isomerase family protein [Glycomyces buryatensis]
MVASRSLAALADESGRLAAALPALTVAQWAAPTRCEPWDCAALLAHTSQAVERLFAMLDAEPPAEATVDAAGYYRPDERFAPEIDRVRVEGSMREGRIGGPALAARFNEMWPEAVRRCEAEGPGRLVTTRHGDPMTLEDFLTTRVVEVAVHGMDLADAAGIERWTGPAAAEVVTDLLLPVGGLDRLGWDGVGFIAKATGRDALTGGEREQVQAAGITWLTLG